MKYSIRDILLLTAIVGLFFAWTCDRGQLEAKHKREVDRLKEQVARSAVREAMLMKKPAIDLNLALPANWCGVAYASQIEESKP